MVIVEHSFRMELSDKCGCYPCWLVHCSAAPGTCCPFYPHYRELREKSGDQAPCCGRTAQFGEAAQETRGGGAATISDAGRAGDSQSVTARCTNPAVIMWSSLFSGTCKLLKMFLEVCDLTEPKKKWHKT